MSGFLEEHKTELSVPKLPYKKRPKPCIICDQLSAGVTNYLFKTNGRNRIGVPFCKLHLDHQEVFATPVFENQEALKLFIKDHSTLFERCVHGKIILFQQPPVSETISIT